MKVNMLHINICEFEFYYVLLLLQKCLFLYYK